MQMKSVVATLLAVMLIAAVANPAAACKGSETLLSGFNGPWVKTYQDKNSWDITEEKVIGRSDEGYGGALSYEGSFFPEAVVCVDIKLPEVITFISGALSIATRDGTYVIHITTTGQALVILSTPDGILTPVPPTPINGMRIGEANKLRVVWGAGRGARVEINDQPAFEFPLAERGRKIGLYVESQGLDIEFSNFKVTRE